MQPLILRPLLAAAAASAGKRGLVGPWCNDSAFFSPLARQWSYNYGVNLNEFAEKWPDTAECAALAAQTEFVPMVASLDALSHVNDPAHRSVVAAGAAHLLGMNEPSAHKNESAEASAARWHEYEAIADSFTPPLRLVSPAPGGLNLENGQKWLKDFFGSCGGCRVDVVAVHFYECNGSTAETAEKAAQDTVAFLDEAYANFGKPLWLTEFNCGDGYPAGNPYANQTKENHLRYMKAVLPRLEAHPHLERYSWFQTWQKNTPSHPGANPGCALVVEDLSALSELGEFYNTYTPLAGER